MSPVLRWGGLAGIVVMLADTVAAMLSQGYPVDSETAATIGTIDIAISVFMYALAGFKAGRAAGFARAGAEAGTLAGGLAGPLAAMLTFLLPNAEGGAPNIVGLIAYNVALGGVLGLFNGWLASRIPETPRADSR